MQTPDTTSGQIAAFVGAAAAVLTILFKLNLTDAQQAGIVGAVVTLWAVGHQIADAIIRNGRSRALTPVAKVDAPAPKTRRRAAK